MTARSLTAEDRAALDRGLGPYRSSTIGKAIDHALADLAAAESELVGQRARAEAAEGRANSDAAYTQGLRDRVEELRGGRDHDVLVKAAMVRALASAEERATKAEADIDSVRSGWRRERDRVDAQLAERTRELADARESRAKVGELNRAQGEALQALRHALLCPDGEQDYSDLRLGREDVEAVVKLGAERDAARQETAAARKSLRNLVAWYDAGLVAGDPPMGLFESARALLAAQPHSAAAEPAPANRLTSLWLRCRCGGCLVLSSPGLGTCEDCGTECRVAITPTPDPDEDAEPAPSPPARERWAIWDTVHGRWTTPREVFRDKPETFASEADCIAALRERGLYRMVGYEPRRLPDAPAPPAPARGWWGVWADAPHFQPGCWAVSGGERAEFPTQEIAESFARSLRAPRRPFATAWRYEPRRLPDAPGETSEQPRAVKAEGPPEPRAGGEARDPTSTPAEAPKGPASTSEAAGNQAKRPSPPAVASAAPASAPSSGDFSGSTMLSANVLSQCGICGFRYGHHAAGCPTQLEPRVEDFWARQTEQLRNEGRAAERAEIVEDMMGQLSSFGLEGRVCVTALIARIESRAHARGKGGG